MQEVYYRSGGLRINPNLYDSGRVCLSLLNTWSGEGCEKWIPYKSSMLQVLVSIQALVLNAKPFFNEPAYAEIKSTPDVEKRSLIYNEGAFILSCRTMLYLVRNPPKVCSTLSFLLFCIIVKVSTHIIRKLQILYMTLAFTMVVLAF